MNVILVIGTDIPRSAALRRLHLDNIGAQVGQNLTAEKPALVGEIEDAIGAEKEAAILSGHASTSGEGMKPDLPECYFSPHVGGVKLKRRWLQRALICA
jgi:hypothetical protein